MQLLQPQQILLLTFAASDIDGSVNADTLDSINSTQFLRSDAADTASELITFQKGIFSRR